MFAYIQGIIQFKFDEYVVLENGGIGYQILTPMPHRFKIGQEITLYTYHHVREDAQVLFGFESLDELNFFKTIITVKGVGPKTGLNILARVPYHKVIDAIENQDVTFLKTLPGIGPKMASQMVLDLKGKLVSSETVDTEDPMFDEVSEMLQGLSFKKTEINSIKKVLLIDEYDNVNDMLKKALQLLSR